MLKCFHSGALSCYVSMLEGADGGLHYNVLSELRYDNQVFYFICRNIECGACF